MDARSAPEPAATLPVPARQHLGPAPRGGLHNPTVGLFFAALAVLAGGVAGHLSGLLAAPLVVLVDSLGLYLGFTVLHDAVHGVADRQPRVTRFLGTVTGFLLTFSHPFFRAIHLRHHGHTNEPEHDPDAITAHLPLWLVPFVGGLAVYGSYHVSFFRDRLWRSRAEWWEVVACDVVYLSILVAALAGGWQRDLLVVWVLPLLLTLHFLVFTFDYLPHYPHDSTARLYNARAYGGWLAAAVHLNQNFHLIHHLWPRVPWFHYGRVYRQMKPWLAERGCRVSFRITPLPPAAQLGEGEVGCDLPRQARQRDAARPDEVWPAVNSPGTPRLRPHSDHGASGKYQLNPADEPSGERVKRSVDSGVPTSA